MRVFVIAVIIFAQAQCLRAAQSSAAQFLKLGFGARALGMGEAFVSVADDGAALYYNPAGLEGERPCCGPNEFSFSHALHVQNTAVSQISFMRRPYAFALTYFSAGQLEGRDENGALTGNFSARDLAVSAGRGFKLGALAAGVSGKFISQNIKNSGAAAFASDLGLLYRFSGTPYALGASVVNLGTKVKFDEESFPLPLALKAGASAAFEKILLALQADFPNDSGAVIRAGAEYRGISGLALRAGYKTSPSDQRDAILGTGLGGSASGVSAMYGFFAGLGFEYSNFKLDYALLPYGELGSAHRFSLGVRF
ncbi:MAG TPA: hypothetical protein DCG50_05460 [Elusimicrobia bacterium]|nr:hypothetical protein [Elusimicrobiota bacterium]